MESTPFTLHHGRGVQIKNSERMTNNLAVLTRKRMSRVNNCVGFKNYKFFYLLLVYAACAEVYTLGLLGYIITLTGNASAFSTWEIVAMVTLAVVGIFACATIGLLVFHTHLISVNQTTIEQLKGIPTDQYSLRGCLNVQMVLGQNPAIWCVPCVWGVSPDFDGVNWDDPKERVTDIGMVNLDGINLSLDPLGLDTHGRVEADEAGAHGGLESAAAVDDKNAQFAPQPADPNVVLGNGQVNVGGGEMLASGGVPLAPTDTVSDSWPPTAPVTPKVRPGLVHAIRPPL